MERSVIHHNNSPFCMRRKQFVFKPILKQRMVHGSLIGAGSKNVFSQLCRHNAGTGIFAPLDPALHDLQSSPYTPLLSRRPVPDMASAFFSCDFQLSQDLLYVGFRTSQSLCYFSLICLRMFRNICSQLRRV